MSEGTQRKLENGEQLDEEEATKLNGHLDDEWDMVTHKLRDPTTPSKEIARLKKLKDDISDAWDALVDSVEEPVWRKWVSKSSSVLYNYAR